MTYTGTFPFPTQSSTISNIQNVYFVYLKADEDQKEGKVAMRTHYDFSYMEPPEDVWCGDLFVAESPGKARVYFLKAFSNVAWIEDWNNIRVRKVGVVTNTKYGSFGMSNYTLFDQFWHRIHEILDHDGKECDCPMEDDIDV